MKNEMIWTKTLLTSYKYLERICGAIDKIVLQSGLNCLDISGQNYFHNNTYAISQRLIDLSDRKITLINLKVLVEEILQDIEQPEADILIKKYCDCLKTHEIANVLSISLRTAFRKIENAEMAFKSRLKTKGYSDIYLKLMLKDEKWIKNVYEQFARKGNQDIILTKAYLSKVASM